MIDPNDAAYAAAADERLPDDLADVALAAEATLAHAGPPAGEPQIEAEADPVLAQAPRTPRRGSFQERIDEVTRARREAERERDFWREAAAAAAQAADHDEGPEPAPAALNPADYPQGEADPGFLRDLVRLEARREIAQAIEAQVQHQQEAALHHAWRGREAQFAQQAPDYYAVFDRDWVCSDIMADAIRTSEDGPAVAYHLARNPDLAQRIFDLPPLAQVRELGRIEAAVGRSSAAAPHHPGVSNAPAPPPQTRGGGARLRVSPDTDDFASFDRAY